jgi:hypothetical protein
MGRALCGHDGAESMRTVNTPALDLLSADGTPLTPHAAEAYLRPTYVLPPATYAVRLGILGGTQAVRVQSIPKRGTPRQ